MLRDDHIKMGLIYTPYVNQKGIPLLKLLIRSMVKNAPKGVPVLSEDSALDVYEEAKRKGYLANARLNWWLGKGGAIDFTNPEAVHWWHQKQKALMEQGIYFFKNDGGEYLPENSTSFIGLQPQEFHNIYSFYYSKGIFEKSQEYHQNKRALIFSRTTWAGTQRFPGIFLGDQTPRYKHIKATMRCGLNMSLLGFAYWGADVFGLYRKPKADTHRRYSQWTLFNPIARYFSAPDVPERNPWGIAHECEASFRNHIELRLRLLPYYYRLAYEAYHLGLPIVRPLAMEFPEEKVTKSMWEQVMIGESLMLSPVLTPNTKQQEVYFPTGKWYQWWNAKLYEGPSWQTIDIKNDEVPLFIKGGSPVVLGPVIQNIPETHQFHSIEVHFYPPFNGATYLYEDDGISTAYQKGELSKQDIHCQTSADNDIISLEISASSGCYQNQPEIRDVSLVMHNLKEPASVSLNREAIHPQKDKDRFWTYDREQEILYVYSKIFTNQINQWQVMMQPSKES